MTTPEDQKKTESNEVPKPIIEKIKEEEISPEEFLKVADLEGQKFIGETASELSNLNSINLDEPTFEKIKSEEGIDSDLDNVNKEAENVIDEKRNLVKEGTKQNKQENPQDIFTTAQEEAANIIIRPEDRNPEGKLLASPGGTESNLTEEYWKLVRTSSFLKWFEGSDVKDENGEPALVYHTTNENLENFVAFSEDKANVKREEKNKKAGVVLVEAGFYFTAGKYEYGKNRLSVFLNAKVKKIEKHGDIMNLQKADKEKIERKGYTGLVHLFQDSEQEWEDETSKVVQNYRRKYAPRTIADKIFYGFNKFDTLFNDKEIYVNANEIKHTASRYLKTRRQELQRLIDIKRDAKTPFFEVCVFKSDQVMIVKKEGNYRNE